MRYAVSPRRVLMTLDAVGGVWRYALDAARGLTEHDIETVLVGCGPRPSAAQAAEAARVPGAALEWLDLPLEWMADGPDELRDLPEALSDLADEHGVDLLHLNSPAQAAGLHTWLPILAVSHSCVFTWWDAVHGGRPPAAWEWQRRMLGDGLRACHAVLAPSAAHAQAVERVHGQVPGLRVVYNASFDTGEPERERERLALAAGRWWDDGKNGATLDRAASVCRWPVLMAGAVEGPNGQRFQARHARALGPLSPDVLRRRLRRAAVAVVPSRYEPFGLVALEAALSGCALVLSDIPVFRELWEGAARFVDPADATGFAETIEALLEDEPARAELARHARLRAGRFSPSRQAARLLVAYRDCLAAVSPPPRLKGLA